MQPEIADNNLRLGKLSVSLVARWRLPLARLAIAVLCIMAVTAKDWLTMADQWWNISTYSHVLFVPFIGVWLIWQRRDVLVQLTPTGWWPGLVLMAGALFLWLLGSLAGVNTASQLGAVLALQAATLALLGPRVAYASLFPLAFMFFLVPFGDEMVPALQMITAKLVIGLTELSGIEAQIEGVFIDTPAGLFEVAEACSGVKFLVAMVALGILVAQTCFTSWKRRALFMLAAITLPIVANGVRAWGTIAIAQTQGIEFAEGFDHVFYGWVFFALVVAALLAGSWRWFDRDPEDSGVEIEDVQSNAIVAALEEFGMNANRAVLTVLGITILFAAWFATASRVEASLPETVSLPNVEGWELVSYNPQLAWEPRAHGAEHRLLGRYRDASGKEVDVFLALYVAQNEGSEASAPGEGALMPDSPWRWLENGPEKSDALSEYYFANGSTRRLAQTSYRTGDLTTGSALQLKLANMRDRLLLRRKPTGMLILSNEHSDKAVSAENVAAFRTALGNEGLWMDRIAGLR